MYQETSMLDVLQSVFGYDTFKSVLQKQAITAICEGSKYVCICMPPGFGRSLCFQLPAVLNKGKVALVFGIKLSSMQKQVEFLKAKGINARLLSQRTNDSERKIIVNDLISKFPKITLLYTTPEMGIKLYFQKIILSLTQHKALSYIVFSEAHSLSQWGYEYVSCYHKLNSFDSVYGYVPRIAVTTAANNKVMKDICKILNMTSPMTFKMPIKQTNVYYDVWFLDTLFYPLWHLKNFVIRVLGLLDISMRKIEKRAVIYCRTESIAEEIRNTLKPFRICILTYNHRHKSSILRDVENKWMSGEASVLITTYDYAFIHKTPIRCIIYWTIPESIPQCYRESAKIQRDSGPRYCRIYFSIKDYASTKLLIENHRVLNDAEYVKKRLKEFEKFVSFCLTLKCRHTMITTYYGHASPHCKTHCDVCEDKDLVRGRTFKFIMYSESVESIKYNICDINESSPEETEDDSSTENYEDPLELNLEACKASYRKDIKDNDSDKSDVQLITNDESLSSHETASVTELSEDLIRGTIDRVIQPTREKPDTKTVMTQSLLKKYNLNKDAISLEPCSSKGVPPRDIKGRNRVSRAQTEKCKSVRPRIMCLNETLSTEKGKRDIPTDFDDVVFIEEQSKRVKKRRISIDEPHDGLRLNKRKRMEFLESKSISGRQVATKKESEHQGAFVKDNRITSHYMTAAYLMNKYKLNKDVVTLEPRKSTKKS